MVNFTSEAMTDRTGNTLFRVSLSDESGEARVRVISLEDYISLLQGSKKMNNHFVHLKEGFLPAGCRNAYVSDDRNYIVEYVVPGRIRMFLHQNGCNRKRYMIPYPDLLFVLQVSEGHISVKKVFSLKGDRLCHYPFGNVSSSGEICMGNIDVKGLSESADSFTDDFFSGITNNDYFAPGENISEKWDQQKLLHKLDGLDKFPNRWLIETGKNIADIDSYVQNLAA